MWVKPHSVNPSGARNSLSEDVRTVVESPGRPLQPELRTQLERRFGHDLSRVRVHSDGPAANSARATRSLAYTVGQHIAFAKGQFRPETPTGRALLEHELMHTVQQRLAHIGSSPIAVAPERPDEPLRTAALQQQPDPSSDKESEPLFAVFVADPRRRSDKTLARSEARADSARIKKLGSLSREDRQIVNAKLTFFQGAAWKTYGDIIRPALREVTREEIEIPAVWAGRGSQNADDDATYAKSEGERDAARIRQSDALSDEDREEFNSKLDFFQGRAWHVYGDTIRPALLEQATRAEAKRDYEGRMAYYLGTRQSVLDQLAADDAQYRKDVHGMAPADIDKNWERGRPSFVAVASAHGHGLNQRQFLRIWLKNWEHRNKEANRHRKDFESAEKHRDPIAFRDKYFDFYGGHLPNAFGPEYRKFVDENTSAEFMFRHSYDALNIISAAHDKGMDLTLEQLDEMVVNVGVWFDAFANIAGAYAGAKGGYPQGTVRPTPSPRPPARDPGVPKDPVQVGGFGRQPSRDPAVPKDPVQVGGFGRQPSRDPAVPKDPVQVGGFGRQPSRDPGVPKDPVQVGGFGRQPSRDPGVPKDPVQVGGFGRGRQPGVPQQGGSGQVTPSPTLQQPSTSGAGTNRNPARTDQRMAPRASAEKPGAGDRGDAPKVGSTSRASEGAGQTPAKVAPDVSRARQLDQLERSGKVSGDVPGLRRGLRSTDSETQRAAQKEFDEIQARVTKGERVDIDDFQQQGRPAGTQSTRISTAEKAELENSGWLKNRLKDPADRRQFMDWLKKGHKEGDRGGEVGASGRQTEGHEHLRPGSREAEAKVREWESEQGRGKE